LRDALRRLESLTAERGRVMLGKLSEVDGRLRETFRALCDDGDASLEYASTPAVLFEEGVSIRARRRLAETRRDAQRRHGRLERCAETR